MRGKKKKDEDLDFFDDDGYEEEPYINEDQEPDIAEDDETQDEEQGKSPSQPSKTVTGIFFSSTRPSKGNRGCSDA